MIRDIVTRNLVTVGPNAKCREIAALMDDKNVGALLVVENGLPKGIITDRDIVIRCLSDPKLDIDQCRAVDFMTTALETVKETDGIYDCIQRMRIAHVRRIPVVDLQGKVIGILSFGDLLGILSKELYELTQATTTLGDTEVKKAA